LIRTRFAPSPTGYLHVGGLRTALYNYLFARKHQGSFILRIEDTDQQRKVKGAVENLIETLRWAGITPDEGPGYGGELGPYIQSQRLELYARLTQELLDKGHAYRCFCSPERLRNLRHAQSSGNSQTGYDRHCRNLSPSDIRQKMQAGEKFVLRMKVPLEGEIVIDDSVRGRVVFPCSLIDDQVLLKTDGFPTYHLANVIDDHHMQISHVIRGEEWLPSTPKHLLLYRYFGWEAPQFAHLPLLLNPDRSKLSKRQGDVAAEDYRQKGYLAPALVNFLALLGWNPGTEQEIFSLDELIQQFSLDRVGKSGAVFNPEKLDWMNGLYIRNLEFDDYYSLAKPYLPETTDYTEAGMREIARVQQQKISMLSELPQKSLAFFIDLPSYTKAEFSEWFEAEQVPRFLTTLLAEVREFTAFDGALFIEAVKAAGKTSQLRGKPLWMVLRIALTGELHGPEIHSVAAILGKTHCLRRLEKAKAYVENQFDQG